MDVSKRIGVYIKEKGYNLAEVARQTGLKYRRLYNALYGSDTRELRASELVVLCEFLDIDAIKLNAPSSTANTR